MQGNISFTQKLILLLCISIDSIDDDKLYIFRLGSNLHRVQRLYISKYFLLAFSYRHNVFYETCMSKTCVQKIIRKDKLKHLPIFCNFYLYEKYPDIRRYKFLIIGIYI